MYSAEHKKYLKNIKKNNIVVLTFQILIIVIFLLIWQLLADLKVINTFISSSPKGIIQTLINLYQTNNLFNHILVTLYETLLSFALGTIIGVLIASLLWWNKILARILDPYLTTLNSLPKVALGPIIIIIAGANQKSIILMALLISVIITIMNVYQSFTLTDEKKIKLLKSFKATKRQIFTYLILPNSLSNIISTLKINLSMSLVGVIMGEFLVSKEGIGYLIMYGSQVFNLNLVWAGIFLLLIISIILYYLIIKFEKKYNKND